MGVMHARSFTALISSCLPSTYRHVFQLYSLTHIYSLDGMYIYTIHANYSYRSIVMLCMTIKFLLVLYIMSLTSYMLSSEKFMTSSCVETLSCLCANKGLRFSSPLLLSKAVFLRYRLMATQMMVVIGREGKRDMA